MYRVIRTINGQRQAHPFASFQDALDICHQNAAYDAYVEQRINGAWVYVTA